MTASVPNVPAVAQTGSIYDIGYRKYEGPRLGRAHAVRSLFLHSLRSSFGIGRGGRAKIAPIILGFLACIPAIAIVAAQALVRQFPGGGALEDQLPVRYETYASTIGVFVILFCAAQAPDLFGRDQRHSLLSLYFSRALRREDYVLARIGGFVVALFILQMLPQLLLFLGQVLLATDVVAAAASDLPELGAATAQSTVTALLLGGLAMAISAFTPRRAYAVAGIIAAFVIPNIVASIVGAFADDIGRWIGLLSPTSILEGTNALFFDLPLGGPFDDVDALPSWVDLAAAATGIVASIGISLRRFQRYTA